MLTCPDADIDAVQANMGAAGAGGMEVMMGTIAEALMERGKAEGLELGKAEGLERGLTRIMERRFGPLSSTVRDRIAAAGPDELDAWLDRVLDADSPEEVFDGSGRH